MGSAVKVKVKLKDMALEFVGFDGKYQSVMGKVESPGKEAKARVRKSARSRRFFDAQGSCLRSKFCNECKRFALV